MRKYLVFLWLVAGLVPIAWAQEETIAKSEGVDDQFFETVDVNVVNVEVFVTDKQGNPVTGLTADDFEVVEDKRPVALTNFYEVREGRRLRPQPAAKQTESELPAEALPAVANEEALPEDQRLFLIVYVDNFNIRPFNRNRVFRRLREFLHDHLDTADQVMLVSYDRSLNVRHPFTSDSSAISRALFDLEELTGHALSQDSERREVLRAIDEAEDALEVEWRVRQYAEALYNDLSFTVDALRDFVGSIAGLEGRKAVLYVSDGLAMTAGEDLFQALLHKFVSSGVSTRMHDFNAQRRFTALTSLAASNRVSFYTIDAAGLRTNNLASADSRGYETPGLTTMLDSTYIQNLQAPLRFMADQTGGAVILNTNNVGPGLERMASDFRAFYSLGYLSGHSEDGRYHRIRVKVKDRKGLKVRHRDGYRAKSSYDRMADGTNSTLLYGFERNPLEVGLRIGGGSQQSDGLYLVPIAVDVPIGKLEMVPRGDFHVGRIKIYFSALDEEERQSDVQEVPLPIRIPSEEMERAVEQPYVYRVELQMRGGSQRMAVGVRDEIGAVESFVVKPVRVGSS
jgi:VWFA-related protein